MNNLFAILISFYITVVLIPPLCRLARKVSLMDTPDERKLHQEVIPRIGGVGIIIGALSPVLLFLFVYRFPLTHQFRAYLVGVLVLFITGLMDDFKSLSYKKKLLGQSLAAVLTILISKVCITNIGIWSTGGEILLPLWIGAPLTFIFIVGVTNAMNLADGLDGLAGGIATLIFATLAVICFLDGRIDLMLGCFVIIGALLAFLRYNTIPAVVFMGDTGSLFLGFSAAMACLYLTQSHSTAVSRTLPLLILGLPIMDTLMVMTARMIRGESPFRPDRKHLHYQLLGLGLSHKYAVIVIYSLQSLMVLLSIRYRYAAEQVIITIYGLVAIAVLGLIFIARAKRWTFTGGTGIVRAWNRYVSRSVSRFLRKMSLAYIKVMLGCGLIWLAISSPLGEGMGIATILVMALITVGAFIVNRGTFHFCFRITAYVLVAVLLLSSQKYSVLQVPFSQQSFHHFVWGSIAAAVFLYLIMTRFRFIETTPLDYIILIMVLSLPLMPVELIGRFHLGTVAGGMLVFFWASEILIRNQKTYVNLFTCACLGAVFIMLVRFISGSHVFALG